MAASGRGRRRRAHAHSGWAGLRLARYIEDHAEPFDIVQARKIAREGQVVRLEIVRGGVDATLRVRGRGAVGVRLRLASFTQEQWRDAVDAMASQAVYSAKLLADEIPANIEDVFAPLALRLFPSREGDLVATVDGEEGWTPEACWAGFVAADRVAEDPFLIFRLRGMEKERLAALLRERRSGVNAGAPGAWAPVYAQRAPANAAAIEPLDACAADFWGSPAGLTEVDVTPKPPEVTHALLRRLGSSPLEGGRFPMVGLLATCYDAIRASVEALESPPD